MKQYLEVHYITKAGMREQFYERICSDGIADASRAEAGNEKYDYYFSAGDPNELLLLEVWKDEEAVRLHGQTPHFARLGELKKEYVSDTVIYRRSE
ncbi:MAG: antibiotic biosynthesis monooxygenase [Ruminococcus sp.]|nr:antibiotic biosynthesis monooxygenase [Ruminococcus sp.]